MSDPLSIAGSAVGIVSLGLSVCTGIHHYLNDLNARPSDIEAARQAVLGMQHLLERVRSMTLNLPGGLVDTNQFISSQVAICERKIRDLDELVQKLVQMRRADGFLHRVEAQGRKMMYPFRRAELQDLEARIAPVNSHLHMAISVLQL